MFKSHRCSTNTFIVWSFVTTWLDYFFGVIRCIYTNLCSWSYSLAVLFTSHLSLLLLAQCLMGTGTGARGNMEKVIIGHGQGSWNPLEAQPAVLLTYPSSQIRVLTTKGTETHLCPRFQMTWREWWRQRMLFTQSGQIWPRYRLGNPHINQPTKTIQTLNLKLYLTVT